VRILFDARSVRTTTGSYIFHGLTSAWREDSRVAEILAAVPENFDVTRLPANVAPVKLPAVGGWLGHVMVALTRAADRVRANVIFCANATGPRDLRSVLYFQDLYHFCYSSRPLPLHTKLFEASRAVWRAVAASHSGLGVAVSHVIAEAAKNEVHRLPIVEIPNGVEVESATWAGDEDVVYVAGGTGHRKSEETAVLAWARLKLHAPSANLEIGGVEPAARRAELQRLVSDLHLGDTVTIRGALPRPAYLERIARARITLSCSRVESFGLPVAEALVMGAPVLCTDLPAHRELLGRANVGETFSVGDDAALATRLRRALDGALPSRLTSRPVGWDWKARGRQHVDAYQTYLCA
jgi:glycosyltransferase involved in cell wall biosynthesis